MATSFGGWGSGLIVSILCYFRLSIGRSWTEHSYLTRFSRLKFYNVILQSKLCLWQTQLKEKTVEELCKSQPMLPCNILQHFLLWFCAQPQWWQQKTRKWLRDLRRPEQWGLACCSWFQTSGNRKVTTTTVTFSHRLARRLKILEFDSFQKFINH